MKAKMSYNFFLLFLLLPANILGETIGNTNLIDWKPGLKSQAISYYNNINVKDFGAVGDGFRDDTNAFLSAINNSPPYSKIVVPEGTYIIKSTLKLKNKTLLKGQGPNKTFLKFYLPRNRNALEVISYSGKKYTRLDSPPVKNKREIIIDDTRNFQTDDYIEIRQDNDPAIITPGRKGKRKWGQASIGQINQISQIIDNRVVLKRPIFFSYNKLYNPRIKKLNVIDNVGIEDLNIEIMNNKGRGYTISFIGAVNCWVNNIISKKTRSAHVLFKNAYANEVRNSIFDGSHRHGSGGQGYGIRTEARSTDNLIENNAFNYLRHSMLVQLGATGNVFAYNYSTNTYTSQSPDWVSADISIHGHYPYLNLFEGNRVDKVEIDNVWGTNGSNTIFRNHIFKPKHKYPALAIAKNNKYQNIIANELGNPKTKGEVINIYHKVITSTVNYANYNISDNKPIGIHNLSMNKLPKSYYLNEKPKFFQHINWPIYGPDQLNSKTKLPAQIRFEEYKNSTN